MAESVPVTSTEQSYVEKLQRISDFKPSARFYEGHCLKEIGLRVVDTDTQHPPLASLQAHQCTLMPTHMHIHSTYICYPDIYVDEIKTNDGTGNDDIDEFTGKSSL